MPLDNPKERKDRCASCGHLRIRHFLVSMTEDCCLHGHAEMGTPAKCKCKKYHDAAMRSGTREVLPTRRDGREPGRK